MLDNTLHSTFDRLDEKTMSCGVRANNYFSLLVLYFVLCIETELSILT